MIITKEIKNDKILEACKKFEKVKNSGVEKFQKLDSWLEREANLYLSEISNKEKKYYKYKKGTIINVNFGVNIGSELCHTHFAIVINSDDNISKDTLIVIPLTSKPGVGKVPLNNVIKDEVVAKVRKKLENDRLTVEDRIVIRRLLNSYKKYSEFSYAFVSQITTISKSRIIYSKNKFDVMNKVKCSKKVIEDIDRMIYKVIEGADIVGMLDEINGEIV